jgi:hypothetical protein
VTSPHGEKDDLSLGAAGGGRPQPPAGFLPPVVSVGAVPASFGSGIVDPAVSPSATDRPDPVVTLLLTGLTLVVAVPILAIVGLIGGVVLAAMSGVDTSSGLEFVGFGDADPWAGWGFTLGAGTGVYGAWWVARLRLRGQSEPRLRAAAYVAAAGAVPVGLFSLLFLFG